MSLPSSHRVYAVWTRSVWRSSGLVNMPTFIDLRADYPLLLTFLGPAYSCALTWSYIASRISPRAIPVPLSRHDQPAPVTIFIRSRFNFCRSACAQSAREFTWRLRPAPACLREYRPHADEQLMPVEHQYANPLGRLNPISAGRQSSLSAKLVACAVVELTPRRSTLCLKVEEP
jgi:hypothetical protein